MSCSPASRLALSCYALLVRRLTPLLFLPILALLVVLTACGRPSPPAPSILTFTSADVSHPLSVPVQQPFQIFLKDCGSDGGYDWTASIASSALLTQVGDPTRHFPSDLPGSPGDYTFHFLPLASGQTTLTFSCARSWEANVPPSQVIHFTFNISSH